MIGVYILIVNSKHGKEVKQNEVNENEGKKRLKTKKRKLNKR